MNFSLECGPSRSALARAWFPEADHVVSLLRSILLAASQNRWLRDHAARYPFVRRSVARFMPGEQLEDALAAAQSLHSKGIGSVFTHLGENIQDRSEARQVTEHYLEVLARIHGSGLASEISVKLTQLGLDLSQEICFDNLKTIIERERPESTVWIDMEASNYVGPTLELYRQALSSYPNVGICLQAYLHRTEKDVEALLPLLPSIRLVKGAYNEPAGIAFSRKRDVDENFFALAQRMLRAKSEGRCRRAAFGTHDTAMIRRISDFTIVEGLPKSGLEVQMLYGIQRGEQERLAKQGFRSVVLVAYGTFWYAWFVRRLAERPANLWFMIRNVFAS
jgi:proline dehydrogenase